MYFEEHILYITWIVSIVSYWLFIPRNKQRNAQVAFLFKLFITWLTGLYVAHLHLIEYPIRFFADVNKSSFTFEFLSYPVICAFFNVFYPESKGKIVKFCCYAGICSTITGVELLFEKYTQLIRYIHWTGYHTWITVFITLYISRLYYRWFFKIP